MNTPKTDWSTKALLLLVCGLLAANLAILSGITTPRVAKADGLPDSGAQLQSIIEGIKGTNQRLDTLEKYLESGAMTVITKTDDKAAK
jgi:hypothetical protein